MKKDWGPFLSKKDTETLNNAFEIMKRTVSELEERLNEPLDKKDQKWFENSLGLILKSTYSRKNSLSYSLPHRLALALQTITAEKCLALRSGVSMGLHSVSGSGKNR